MNEQAFQSWYRNYASQLGLSPNPDDPQHFYDWRGAYNAGATPNAENHWPSEFKREGHPNLIVNGKDTRTGLPIMADYPDDYSNPLPSMAGAGPTQQGLGAGNFVNSPMGQPPMNAGSDATMGQLPQGSGNPVLDKRMEYLQRLSNNPMYKIGSAMSGRDPVGTQMMQQQHMIQQQQQFMLTKQVTVGGMLLNYMNDISKIEDPAKRAAVAQTGAKFLGPLLQELGYQADPSLFKSLIDVPDAPATLGNLISSRFGNDPAKTNELLAHLSKLKPDQQIPAIKQMYEMDVEAALGPQMANMTGLMAKVRSNPSLMQQLGAISKEGKNQSIDTSILEPHFLQNAKTPAERDAVMRILKGGDYTGFLAGRGLQTGATAESMQKVVGDITAKESTPTGQLETESKKADLALKGEELKAKPAQLALTQAQTQAALTPSVIPLAGVNTGIAVQGKGAGARPEIVLPPTQAPKDLTPAEKNTQSEELASAEKLIGLNKLYKPAYVGVATGRIQGLKEPLGMVSGLESEFRAAVAALRNETLHRLSGAAVNPEEYKRIESELPTVNNAPSVFEARIKLTAKNLKMLMEMRRKVLKSQGTDVDNLPPIPDDLGKPTTMPPAKRVP